MMTATRMTDRSEAMRSNQWERLAEQLASDLLADRVDFLAHIAVLRWDEGDKHVTVGVIAFDLTEQEFSFVFRKVAFQRDELARQIGMSIRLVKPPLKIS